MATHPPWDTHVFFYLSPCTTQTVWIKHLTAEVLTQQQDICFNFLLLRRRAQTQMNFQDPRLMEEESRFFREVLSYAQQPRAFHILLHTMKSRDKDKLIM